MKGHSRTQQGRGIGRAGTSGMGGADVADLRRTEHPHGMEKLGPGFGGERTRERREIAGLGRGDEMLEIRESGEGGMGEPAARMNAGR